MTGFDFFSNDEYFSELTRCARKASKGDEILVMGMVFDPESPSVGELAEALAEAAGRGVQVNLVTDANTFLIKDDRHLGPLFFGADLDMEKPRHPFDAAFDALENLRRNGGTYHIVNRPQRRFSNPYAGCSHIKLALINDRILLGSCNLEDLGDYNLTLGWRDSRTADWLRSLVDSITANRSVRQALSDTDQTFEADRQTRIFVDAGVRKQSLILQKAHQLIDDAKEELVMTCQYFPGGSTARRLLAAHQRGVEVKILFSPPSAHGLLAPLHWVHNRREQLRLPEAIFSHQLPSKAPKMHAKILASESAAMVGSHNYVDQGVNFGTAEIALLTHDQEAIIEIQAYAAKLAQQSSS